LVDADDWETIDEMSVDVDVEAVDDDDDDDDDEEDDEEEDDDEEEEDDDDLDLEDIVALYDNARNGDVDGDDNVDAIVEHFSLGTDAVVFVGLVFIVLVCFLLQDNIECEGFNCSTVPSLGSSISKTDESL
jgi:hypothetical protein